MARQQANLNAFNRGLISPLALARTDFERTALSAEVQTNWMPRFLGSMMLRPGSEYIHSTLDHAYSRYLKFIFSRNDTALIELTDSVMRVFVDEEVISRGVVTAAVTNGSFTIDLTGWTDSDESGGATSDWVFGSFMGLTGTGFNSAVRTQEVTVNEPDTEHALRVVIQEGPVTIRIGSFLDGDDYLTEAVLRTGTYSFAFTPTANFFIRLSSPEQYLVLVKSVNIESSGEMQLPTPWAEDNLDMIRYDQSGDVLFLACEDIRQRRIERYSERSWGICNYNPTDGPFRIENTTNITLTPSGLTGNVQIDSSSSMFKEGHLGALLKITSIGQRVEIDVTAENQFSDPIKITGVGTSRDFTVTRAGTWSAQVTLQRSVGEVGSWVNTGTVYTTNGTSTVSDGLDNQIIYYRIGVATGEYTSGTAELSMSYSAGGLTGIGQVTSYTSPTAVQVRVIRAFGATTASSIWAEGQWSDYRGYPSAVTLYEGRLWWGGKDKINGSVSDAFESFDDETEGDSGPISRSIGSGPVDRVNWLLPLLRLVVGGELAERTARSSSLDEPLTPTNFNLKIPSTRGSIAADPGLLDSGGLFLSEDRLYLLSYQGDVTAVDYTSEDLTILVPEIGESGFKRIAVQRYPDTRIHCVRNDGSVGIFVFDRTENIKCWVLYETGEDGDDSVEDVVVMPREEGEIEDKVYYVVNRSVNDLPVRYFERWALESECIGSTLNKNMDSLITYSGVETTSITGLDHMEGWGVVAWGGGVDLGDYTVSGGAITISTASSEVVVGLPYIAQFKSTKLAYAAQNGTALTQPKRVNHLGVILRNTHYQGLKYGKDFDHLFNLPKVVGGSSTEDDTIWENYDERMFAFPGSWDTDSRVCLQAESPRPCTLLAAVMSIETNERS